MGNVSYALMRKLIYRRITQEVFNCVESYQKQAIAVDRTDPTCMEKLLSLSVQCQNDCKQIAIHILNEYDVEVANDKELGNYKKDLLKNGSK